jgi:hypothetical protein
LTIAPVFGDPSATPPPDGLGPEGGAIEGRIGRSGRSEGVLPPATGPPGSSGPPARKTGKERMAIVPNVVAMNSAIATCLALCPF